MMSCILPFLLFMPPSFLWLRSLHRAGYSSCWGDRCALHQQQACVLPFLVTSGWSREALTSKAYLQRQPLTSGDWLSPQVPKGMLLPGPLSLSRSTALPGLGLLRGMKSQMECLFWFALFLLFFFIISQLSFRTFLCDF